MTEPEAQLIETPVEEEKPAEEETPKDEVVEAIDKQIKEREESPNLADEYGADDLNSPFSNPKQADNADASKKSAKDSRIDELEQENQTLRERGKLDEVLKKIDDKYPNAYPNTVQRLVRGRASLEHIESIAKASDSDFNRGEVSGLKKAKETYEKQIGEGFEKGEREAKEAFGQPWQEGKKAGGASIDPGEFQERLKKCKSEAEADALFKRVKWSDSNPFKDL